MTRAPAQRTAIRLCASCGQSFTWASRNPRRRFCASICKAPPSPVQNCPNCHQPVAVINLLITPAAAYINTLSRSVTERS